MTTKSLANLGPIMQIAFVPKDFEATIDHWVKKGAGPFFVLKGTKAEYQTCYGKEAYPILDIALGHWGDMQIEIIRQTSPEKSVYKDWRDEGREGVHHTCITVDDLAEAKRACEAVGAPIVIEGRVGPTEWFYADTGGGPGSLLEVIRYPPGSEGLMTMIRDAARNWDGSNPVREIAIPPQS
jgi:catechol 2,3-dioxygenase-like lactoylglutathione lyase family enzyme